MLTGSASPLSYFNSTMVRLKGWRNKHGRNAINDFNSTMVRLKGTPLFPTAFAVFYFNSTMVRLKGFVILLYNYIVMISIPLWFG